MNAPQQPTHAQTHLFTSIGLVIDTSKTAVPIFRVFFLSFQFFANFFCFSVYWCFLPYQLCLSFLNNSSGMLLFQPCLRQLCQLKETNHLSPQFEISPLSPESFGFLIYLFLTYVLYIMQTTPMHCERFIYTSAKAYPEV